MRAFKNTVTSALLTICVLFQLTLSAKAEGYGDFNAYIVGLADNELVSVRSEPKKSANKVGAILGNAEDIYVHWCDKYDDVMWCDVTHKKLRGWILSKYLQNVEGG